MLVASHPITPKLVDGLYTESMLLADEARSYFDSDRARSISLAEVAVAFSCESLKVTTRLMHVIACDCMAVEPKGFAGWRTFTR